MVSLVKLSEVTEDGVKFQSPHDQTEMLLSPEKSIEIQNIIGKNVLEWEFNLISYNLCLYWETVKRRS